MTVAIQSARLTAMLAGMRVAPSKGFRVVSYANGRGTWYAASTLGAAQRRVAELTALGFMAEVFRGDKPLNP